MKMEVNIGRLEEIVGDDTEMKKMLLQMFIDTCDRVAKRAEESLRLSDDEADKEWKEAVHELKGAAMNLGFEDLSEYCKRVEKEPLAVEQKSEAINIFSDAKIKVLKLKDSF